MSARTKRTGSWEANKGVNAVLCFSESGFFKKNSHPIKFQTIHVMFPPSPNSMLYSELCVWRPSKKTTIFVHSVRHFQAQHWSWGLRGQCLHLWCFLWMVVFFEEPGESFFCFQSFSTKKTGNKKILPGLRKTQNSIHPFVCFSASCPFVRADIDWHYAFPGALKHMARTELNQKLLQI